MKTATLFAIVFGLAFSPTSLLAQSQKEAGLARLAECNCKVEAAGDSIHMINTRGSTAILWLREARFDNGTIELNIKGKDVRGESFVGVAFHATDSKTYHAVYFRPFNFRDPEKIDRAVQYVQLPENDWDVLREKTPGKYEHRIVPDTDPNAWFHVKIVVHYPSIQVYLNRASEPTLKVDQLNSVNEGKLGLWIDGVEGWFKDVRVTRSK